MRMCDDEDDDDDDDDDYDDDIATPSSIHRFDSDMALIES